MIKSIRKALRKKNESFRQMRKVEQTIATTTRSQYLQNLALHNTSSLVNNNVQREHELIISLTTYSKRIHDVHLVIESLSEQTVKANRIILWLDEDEFSQSTIPEILKLQQDRGLEIRFCPNYRSYKKLVPTLKLEPDADVITVDDDLLYPYDMIEMLVKEKLDYPQCIIGTRAHEMLVKDKSLLPYKSWLKECSYQNNGSKTFLTTGAGTLFPAGVFPKEALEPKEFLNFCPSADDIWFNLIALKYGISRRKLSDDRKFVSRFLHLESNQDIGLNKQNVNNNQNDIQAKKVIEHFNIEFF